MLEIRRWKANRAYENTFFREFAKNLKDFFDRKNKEWLLIANSFCELDETLQIDALLITESSICLIDFKNFWWKVHLPNNEYSFWHIEWINEEWTRIKGWSSINPYAQLRKQKWKFSSIIKENIIKKLKDKDYLNPRNTKKIVCFQKNIELIGNIPKKDEIDFLIMDNSNYLEVISDVIDIEDKEVILSKNSFNLFKEFFKANEFEINETYVNNDEPIFTDYSKELNYNGLEKDQKNALKNIEDFIKDENEKIFILQWTVWSWKTYLIDFIEDLAFKNNISDIEKIVQSTRIARNLSSNSNIQFNSMYSTIYWWKNKKDDTLDSKDWILEIVPIKNNDDNDNTIYIVDESQLIWDNYNQSFDLRFWSWMLLKDFIDYVKLDTTRRKIIFIWDLFQLNIWKNWENSLFKSYINDTYNIKNIKYYQLNDKEDKHFLWKQIFWLVKSIRNNIFNNLNFHESNNLHLIDRESILDLTKKKLENNTDFHILNYSNNDSNKINLWIKNNILKNGVDLSKWDLVLINNNISIINQDPFSTPQKIYNWEFWIIKSVSDVIISENVEVEKWKNILLKFREVELILNLSKETVKIFSFENYRLSDRWELSQEEIKTFHIILNREIKDSYIKIPFEESNLFINIKNHKYYVKEKNFIGKVIEDWKTKVENDEQKELKIFINKLKKEDREYRKRKILTNRDSKSYMIKNSAYLKYWWALTVHKSISYKWDEVLINTETLGWKTNETYFKWLYTSLTRAKKKIYLINFKQINVFSWVNYWEQISNNDKKILLKIDENIDLWESDKELIKKYNFPKDYSNMLFQFYKFIETKLSWNEIIISNIIHNQYQENYELERWDDNINFNVYYNNKWEFKSLVLNNSNSNNFKKKVENLLENENKIKDFWFIANLWRKETYEKLSLDLKQENIYFKYIIQNKYQDNIKLSQLWKIIIFDINYNSEWFITKIILKYSDDNDIWETLKNIIKKSYNAW